MVSVASRPDLESWSGQFFYTELVAAHWRKTTIGPNGELVLKDLPFQPGQPVQVLILPSPPPEDRSLQNSVLDFLDPLDPIALDDWEFLH